MRDDNKGRGQCRPRVIFPDEAVALRLPIEVAVSLYFAKGVAMGTKRSRVTRGQSQQETNVRC